ncbi:uncharacterized protein LOC141912153 [Tubulanus polymorphus]|uniref:uncharacterized protein LOC141912153 n=1 Tax=Tubulanus polymorphus TaxID=672921 RepID=UPI003DA440AB
MDGVLDLSSKGTNDVSTTENSTDRAVSLVKPVAGPVPVSHFGVADHQFYASRMAKIPSHQRPFKLYPFRPEILATQMQYLDFTTKQHNSGNTPSRKRRCTDEVDDEERTPSENRNSPILDSEDRIDSKDVAYLNRRRKNNEAAKRSRDMRRAKEEQTKNRVAYLEHENLKLQTQVSLLKTENSKLHYMLFTNSNKAHKEQS